MDILNKYCPRSGKPVQEDSLAKYRGFTVGFCNPGCRDDFASNIEGGRPEDRRYFNTLIKERNYAPTLVKARPQDKVAVEQLLKSCELPFSDLTEDHLEHFFLYKNDPDILGIIGLEIYQDNGLLRSLAVKKEYRNQGFGIRLVEKIENYAIDEGIKEMYLLTTTAEKFFAAHGYEKISRELIPETVQQSVEFSTLCPASARAMKKDFSQ